MGLKVHWTTEEKADVHCSKFNWSEIKKRSECKYIDCSQISNTKLLPKIHKFLPTTYDRVGDILCQFFDCIWIYKYHNII